MKGGIYLIQGNGELVEMAEQPYDSEDLLQGLLARYPSLLAGAQMDPAAPRRWLLVSREAAVPSEEGGANRWAVDHLFLDQEAIPTLVEVKRSSDTRIRREVVGQMLDYAANAVVYWPIEKLRAQFEANCQVQGSDPERLLDDFLGPDADHEEFWQNAKTNLQAGKIRLVFVADEIPTELRRVVEFLNAQMDPAEVLAVEIRQYVGEGLQTLVPTVVGRTERKGTGRERGERWDWQRFSVELRRQSTVAEVALAEDLLNFGTEITARPVEWGTGKDRGSFTARLIVGDDRFSLFSIYTTGEFSVNWGWNSQRLGTDISEKYRSEVNKKLGVSFGRLSWERGWPMADLSTLVSDKAAYLKELVREFVARI